MALKNTRLSDNMFNAFDIDDMSTVQGTTDVVDISNTITKRADSIVLQIEIAGASAQEDGVVLAYKRSLTSVGLDSAQSYTLHTYANGVDGNDFVGIFELPDTVNEIPYSKEDFVRLSLTVPGGAAQGSVKVYIKVIEDDIERVNTLL